MWLLQETVVCRLLLVLTSYLMVVWGAQQSQDHDGWGEKLTLLKMSDSRKLKFKQLAPFYANAKQVKCIAVGVAASPR